MTIKNRNIADGAVSGIKLGTGILHVSLVTGGAAGDLTLTGITTDDEIVAVMVFTTAAAIATVADLTDEFTITAADTINNTGGTSTANNQVQVFWMSHGS